jgi:hypothetical protein
MSRSGYEVVFLIGLILVFCRAVWDEIWRRKH